MKYPAWLTRVPHFDKWLHGIGCLIVYGIFRAVGIPPLVSLITITLGAGLKEILWDRAKPGRTPSWGDFWAGVIPVGVIFLFETL